MDAYAQQLLKHLPFLRRYARALTGTGEKGDELVGQAVQEALDDPEGHGLGGRDRSPLYALLNRLHDASGSPKPVPQDGHPMEKALAALPEVERRLFLLVSLEELGFAEAAGIMGLPLEEAHGRMVKAQEALREALIANIMIVEDDAVIAFDLAETVRNMGHHVCGTAATMDAALTTAKRNRPTLALMDLRLAHGDSGITTAQMLRQSSELPIIFVTAFGDELTRRGLEHLGPVIRKPFTREQIERAITQAVFAPTREPNSPALAALAGQGGHPGH
ncbi:response regulator [Aerophototrophica crusticola]|uniref:Response regulator n=1 Tax=Aerophototrophica crusticola TaxID=1709002 RepID=A0A858R904_9PROT|nr:response regulator [Rhodospirillaceae bacterium B3]